MVINVKIYKFIFFQQSNYFNIESVLNDTLEKGLILHPDETKDWMWLLGKRSKQNK